MPETARTNVPLNDLLQGNIKGKTPHQWTLDGVKAFEKAKADLVRAILLSHPRAGASLGLVCDASAAPFSSSAQATRGNRWVSFPKN